MVSLVARQIADDPSGFDTALVSTADLAARLGWTRATVASAIKAAVRLRWLSQPPSSAGAPLRLRLRALPASVSEMVASDPWRDLVDALADMQPEDALPKSGNAGGGATCYPCDRQVRTFSTRGDTTNHDAEGSERERRLAVLVALLRSADHPAWWAGTESTFSQKARGAEDDEMVQRTVTRTAEPLAWLTAVAHAADLWSMGQDVADIVPGRTKRVRTILDRELGADWTSAADIVDRLDTWADRTGGREQQVERTSRRAAEKADRMSEVARSKILGLALSDVLVDAGPVPAPPIKTSRVRGGWKGRLERLETAHAMGRLAWVRAVADGVAGRADLDDCRDEVRGLLAGRLRKSGWSTGEAKDLAGRAVPELADTDREARAVRLANARAGVDRLIVAVGPVPAAGADRDQADEWTAAWTATLDQSGLPAIMRPDVRAVVRSTLEGAGWSADRARTLARTLVPPAAG